MLVSYAQNFEDVMLWRALKHVEKGFYVDVGAQHPVIDSVSLAFYERGWRGVHIEPVPFYANLLREHRPDEVVIQAAIDAKQGLLTFFDIKETGLSTADEGIAHRHQEAGFEIRQIAVPCLTLDEVLSPFIGKEIHWLKIDVEGYEHQIIEGWKHESIKPWVVVIESTLPLAQTESYQGWEPLILERGYQFVYFDGLNRFYISSEHPDLLDAFRCGPNVFDGFALSGTASNSFCTNLNAKAEEVSQQGQALERELAQSRERLQALKSELTQSKSAGAQLEQRLGALEAELAAVYRSLSWRMTVLLREVNPLVKQSIRMIGTGVSTLISNPRRAAQRVVHASLAHVQAWPDRKTKVVRLSRSIVTSIFGEIANSARSVPAVVRIVHKVKMRFPKLWEKTAEKLLSAQGQHRPLQTSASKNVVEYVAGISLEHTAITISDIKRRLQKEVSRQKSHGLL